MSTSTITSKARVLEFRNHLEEEKAKAAEKIREALQTLHDNTGMYPRRVSFELMEASTMGSPYREVIVTGVEVEGNF